VTRVERRGDDPAINHADARKWPVGRERSRSVYLRDSPVALSAMTASTVGAAIMKYQSTALASISTPRRESKSRTCRTYEQTERCRMDARHVQ
jgi:hypothetical protein